MLRASVLIALAACTAAPPSDDVVGPFTGARHRFVIDRIELPHDYNSARALGDDLDGDGIVDNQLGSVIGSLAGQGNVTSHADDMIAAGALTSVVEIQADDLTNDEGVGVWYYGAAGDPATPVGGTLVDGTFVSNRSRTTSVPGKAVLRLPVFADADPATIELVAMQLDLTPDGLGGFDGVVRGGVRRPPALSAALEGMVQMFEARPQDHRDFWSLVDRNHDGVVTLAELDADNSLLRAILTTDIVLGVDGESVELLSVGFRIHLAACDAGRCALQTAIDRCFDRVIDGDESDIDCGGSCGDCPADGMCRTGADCQSGGCDGGLCRPPSCSDGLLDGFESNVDCGGACSGCPSFTACTFPSDCASGNCGANGICF
jgi:hypothetical protein